MKLKQVDVNTDPALRKKAKALYRQAFPKEERVPWWLLRCNARREGIDLTAWLDEERFCGFTASVTADDLHFLLFFAIHPALRGRGYGSAILAAVQEAYETVVLNVEPLTDTAPNLAERQRRFAFYGRNGFRDTGYYVWEVGGKFRVLSNDPVLDVAGYKKLFRKLTCGLWDVRLEPAGEQKETKP